MFCVPRGWDSQHRGPCASVLANMRALMSQYCVPASMGAATGSAGRVEGQGSSWQQLPSIRSMQTLTFLKGKQGVQRGGLGACLWLGFPLVNSSSSLSFSRLSSQTPSTDFSGLVSPNCGPLCSPLGSDSPVWPSVPAQGLVQRASARPPWGQQDSVRLML